MLAKLHKLLKNHAAYLKDIYYRKDDSKPWKARNDTKFEIGLPVMVKNYAHHVLEPENLTDYRVLKILNESTLILVTPNSREHKTNISDVKPATTPELVDSAWDSFLSSIPTHVIRGSTALQVHKWALHLPPSWCSIGILTVCIHSLLWHWHHLPQWLHGCLMLPKLKSD